MSNNKEFSSTSANRYSLALYELAKDSNSLVNVEINAKAFLNLISNNKDFKKLKKHIIKNVYRNVFDFGNAPNLLVKYCEKIFLEFDSKKEQYFLSNEFKFPKYE